MIIQVLTIHFSKGLRYQYALRVFGRYFEKSGPTQGHTTAATCSTFESGHDIFAVDQANTSELLLKNYSISLIWSWSKSEPTLVTRPSCPIYTSTVFSIDLGLGYSSLVSRFSRVMSDPLCFMANTSPVIIFSSSPHSLLAQL